MKIFIICSKSFYNKIPKIKKDLEKNGHIITLPNCYDNPQAEDKYRNMGKEEHAKFKSEMIRHSEDVIGSNDAVLVINFTKNGVDNYIGGATFLEMYDAFRLNKKIFMYNDIPEGILHDELIGFCPIILKGNLDRII
jgi:hypothetical protein